MTQAQRDEITKISKEFAKPFESTIGPIHGSGWVIVDPLSGYLNACGFTHTVSQLAANKKHPQVLVLTFPDGSHFIPAGLDLLKLDKKASNWMWLGAPTPPTEGAQQQ